MLSFKSVRPLCFRGVHFRSALSKVSFDVFFIGFSVIPSSKMDNNLSFRRDAKVQYAGLVFRIRPAEGVDS